MIAPPVEGAVKLVPGLALAEGRKSNVRINGGWGGIRTPGGREPTAVFKTAALNHSATHPVGAIYGKAAAEGNTDPASPRTPVSSGGTVAS